MQTGEHREEELSHHCLIATDHQLCHLWKEEKRQTPRIRVVISHWKWFGLSVISALDWVWDPK